MMDLIDRQAAIKALEETKQPDPFNRYEYQNIGIDWSIDAIMALPSAQPVWIPLAVKYPETNEDVLLQFPSNQGVGFYENGSWGINTGDGIYSAIGDGEEMPMAWMPLPKPWEGEPNE